MSSCQFCICVCDRKSSWCCWWCHVFACMRVCVCVCVCVCVHTPVISLCQISLVPRLGTKSKRERERRAWQRMWGVKWGGGEGFGSLNSIKYVYVKWVFSQKWLKPFCRLDPSSQMEVFTDFLVFCDVKQNVTLDLACKTWPCYLISDISILLYNGWTWAEMRHNRGICRHMQCFSQYRMLNSCVILYLTGTALTVS